MMMMRTVALWKQPQLITSWCEVTRDYIRWTSGHERAGKHCVVVNPLDMPCLAILAIPLPFPRVVLSVQTSKQHTAGIHTITDPQHLVVRCLRCESTGQPMTTDAEPTVWTLYDAKHLLDVHQKEVRLWHPSRVHIQGRFEFDAHDEAAGGYMCVATFGRAVVFGGRAAIRLDNIDGARRTYVASHQTQHCITSIAVGPVCVAAGDDAGLVHVFSSMDLSALHRFGLPKPERISSVSFGRSDASVLWVASRSHVVVKTGLDQGSCDDGDRPLHEEDGPCRVFAIERGQKMVVMCGRRVEVVSLNTGCTIPCALNILADGILCPVPAFI